MIAGFPLDFVVWVTVSGLASVFGMWIIYRKGNEMDNILVQALIILGATLTALIVLTVWAMCRVSGRLSEEERIEADLAEVLDRDLSVYCAKEGMGFRNE